MTKLKLGNRSFFCLDVTIRVWENGVIVQGDVLGGDGKVYSIKGVRSGEVEEEIAIQVDKLELGD